MIFLTILVSSLVANDASSVFAVEIKRSWEISNWDNRCYLPRCPDHANYEVTGVMESWHGDKWPTELVFTCWPGYTLVGSRTIACYDGRWSDHTPQCINYQHRRPHDEYGFPDYESADYNIESSPDFPLQNSQQQFIPHVQQPESQQQFIPHVQQPESQPQQQLTPDHHQTLSEPTKFKPHLQNPVPLIKPLISQEQQPIPQSQPVSQQQELIVQSQQQKPVLETQPLVPNQQEPLSPSRLFATRPILPILHRHPVKHPQLKQFKPQQQQALSEEQELISKKQEPVTQQQEPVTQQQEPVTQQQESVTQQQESVTQQQEPVTQQQEPTTQQQEPVTQQQEPVTQQQEPVTQQQESVTQQQERLSRQPGSVSETQDLIPQNQQSAPEPSLRTSQPPIAQMPKEDIQDQQPAGSLNSSEGMPLREKTNISSEDSCVLPPFPENGSYMIKGELTSITPGQTVANAELRLTRAELMFTCIDGYVVIPVKNVVVKCVNGTWSPKIPVCFNKDNVIGLPDPTEAPNTGNCECSRRQQPNNLVCYKMETFVSVIPTVNHGVGGYRARRNELPWHVGIYDKSTTPYTQICGGSIISQKVVLTAAHCFWADLEKQPAEQYAVGAGKLYRSWDDKGDSSAQKLDVKDIRIPIRYQDSATNFQEDIALVIVDKEFIFNDDVRPVCLNFNHSLDTTQLQEENIGMVSGWGLIAENGDSANELQVLRMPYVSTERCFRENDPSFQKYITSDKFCAGYKNGTALCKGDSGGGLVFIEEVGDQKRYYLRGIASTAPSNDNACNIYAWTTFTHLLRHEHFITSVVAEYPLQKEDDKNFINFVQIRPNIFKFDI